MATVSDVGAAAAEPISMEGCGKNDYHMESNEDRNSDVKESDIEDDTMQQVDICIDSKEVAVLTKCVSIAWSLRVLATQITISRYPGRKQVGLQGTEACLLRINVDEFPSRVENR